MPAFVGTRRALLKGGGVAPWTPLSAAAPLWLDGSDLATLYQDRTGASATTPGTVDSVVGSWLNKGSIGGWFTAPANSARPVLRLSSGAFGLEYDGTDDILSGVLSGFVSGAGRSLIAVAAKMINTSPRKVFSFGTLATQQARALGSRSGKVDAGINGYDHTTATSWDNQTRVAIWDLNGAVSTLYIDALSPVSTSLGGAPNTTGISASTGWFAGSEWALGTINQIVGFSGDATALIPQLRTFLAGKSGVTL